MTIFNVALVVDCLLLLVLYCFIRFYYYTIVLNYCSPSCLNCSSKGKIHKKEMFIHSLFLMNKRPVKNNLTAQFTYKHKINIEIKIYNLLPCQPHTW